MRLTKFHKTVFVRAVINDLPTYEKEKDEIRAQRAAVIKRAVDRSVPVKLKEFWEDNPDMRRHIKTHNKWDGRNYIKNVIGDDLPFDADVNTELDRLERLEASYGTKRYELEVELKEAVMGITTLAKLKEAFPQFEKYMPQDTTPPKTANVPAVVIQGLTEKLAAAGLQLPELPQPLPDFIVDPAPVPIPPEAVPAPIHSPIVVDGMVVAIPAPELVAQ